MCSYVYNFTTAVPLISSCLYTNRVLPHWDFFFLHSFPGIVLLFFFFLDFIFHFFFLTVAGVQCKHKIAWFLIVFFKQKFLNRMFRECFFCFFSDAFIEILGRILKDCPILHPLFILIFYFKISIFFEISQLLKIELKNQTITEIPLLINFQNLTKFYTFSYILKTFRVFWMILKIWQISTKSPWEFFRVLTLRRRFFERTREQGS